MKSIKHYNYIMSKNDLDILKKEYQYTYYKSSNLNLNLGIDEFYYTIIIDNEEYIIYTYYINFICYFKVFDSKLNEFKFSNFSNSKKSIILFSAVCDIFKKYGIRYFKYNINIPFKYYKLYVKLFNKKTEFYKSKSHTIKYKYKPLNNLYTIEVYSYWEYINLENWRLKFKSIIKTNQN